MTAFQNALLDLSVKLVRNLDRHAERYIRAYCARYGIGPEDFDQYELVSEIRYPPPDANWQVGIEHVTYMRRRQ